MVAVALLSSGLSFNNRSSQMAHFAEIDGDSKVLRVIVVDNEDIKDEHDAEQESIGKAFIADPMGVNLEGTWVPTSYNDNFRKQYAGIGMFYDAVKNKFIDEQPFSSWELDENDDWQSPVQKPNERDDWDWNEEEQQWDLIKSRA